MSKVELGSKVKDIETGYTGKVTARAEYLYDVPTLLVENVDSTGRPIEWWVKETRAEVIE